MDSTIFAFDQKQGKWAQASLLPIPPNYTPILVEAPIMYEDFTRKTDKQNARYRVFCARHGAWESVSSVLTGSDGKKLIVASCGQPAPPPYIANGSRVPFAYTVKAYGNQSFVSFAVHQVLFKDAKKVKVELNFTVSTVTGRMENSEKKFDVANDKMDIPQEVIEFIIMLVGKPFAKDFGFTPTLTSKVRDISVVSGYVKYPFNANLAELQKVSGMQKFKVARDDSLNENKMYEFLAIKPNKALRKKYTEFPFAPIIWKFFEKLGFKDANLINPLLDNKTVHQFLKDHWVRYDCEERCVTFNGDVQLVFFTEESLKRNKEKTALGALFMGLETEEKAASDWRNYSALFDSIGMIQANLHRIPDAVLKEIFHDGITDRTHDNLVNMFRFMDMSITEEQRRCPFAYSERDLRLCYQDVETATGRVIADFQLPQNESELVAFGKKMRNCVGWGMYTQKVRQRMATIVAVYVEEKPSMCLELDVHHEIVQALGVCNCRLNAFQCDIIKDWAERKNVGLGVLSV